MLSTLESRIRWAGKRIASRHPVFRRSLLGLWNAYVCLYPHVVNGLAAGRSPLGDTFRPFRVVDVDPARIDRLVEYSPLPRQARDRQEFDGPKFKYAGAVVDGDWDRKTLFFEDSELYQSFAAHFEDGVAWSETPFFQTVVAYIEDGTALWGCTSRDAFERRCAELDRLYAAIDEHGYLSQRELMTNAVEDPVEGNQWLPYHVRLVNHELTVCLGRDGEFLFKDGRDRLAIAKLLDLDAIPVWILVRHERWQRLRETVASRPETKDSLDQRLRTHPDLP